MFQMINFYMTHTILLLVHKSPTKGQRKYVPMAKHLSTMCKAPSSIPALQIYKFTHKNHKSLTPIGESLIFKEILEQVSLNMREVQTELSWSIRDSGVGPFILR